MLVLKTWSLDVDKLFYSYFFKPIPRQDTYKMLTPGGGGYGVKGAVDGRSNNKKRALNNDDVDGEQYITSAGSLNQYKMMQESV